MPAVAPAKRILIEACVGNLEDALAAARIGADRLEFCSALEVGGLTPDFEDVARLRDRASLPIMAMVRPRAGDFCYSDSEWTRMLNDARRLLRLGVDGIVFGVLTSELRIDIERTSEMTAVARSANGKQVVFHKAFDESRNLQEAWWELSAFGIDRVLTSGGAATALDGARTLKSLIDGGGPTVLIGGGVRAENASEILRLTGGAEIHSSCRSVGSSRFRLDHEALASLIAAVRAFEIAS